MNLSKPVVALCMILIWQHLIAVPGLAWQQDTPPIELSVSSDPLVATNGKVLILTITATNTGNTSLKKVRVQAAIPEYTVMEGASVNGETWTVSTPLRGERGMITFSGELMSGESKQLGVLVIVQQQTGDRVVFDDYSAIAEGYETPVKGTPFAIGVGTTPTPGITLTQTATPTATAMPTRTAEATPTATSTATPLPVPSSTPSSTPSPTPSPTITVVMAELPPTDLPPTATPNLSTEQVQLGTLTVSVFVVLTVILVVISVVWMIKKSKG
jgi:uncharacterized repeat protein (TIGR01451 family)